MTKRISALLLAVILTFSLFAAAQGPATSKADINKRVEAILSKMTLEEKIDYIGGYRAFYIRAIPRLGVPELKMADGPVGVRNYGPSTTYPAGIAMAASWDTALVQQIGASIGRDARARGVHFMLAPGMNIYRAPMNGRNFEYFGEDPFLASRTAVADIEGIQSQGVIATAKHFAANNQEWDRHRISSDVDERTLREIYLPAFEASVKEAHVGAIMDSYNFVNGLHSTQNPHLNIDIARKDWGFTGIIMSDWDATYDGVAAANGGLDLEMPAGTFMNRETLIPAIKEGKVSEATIDDKVRHILYTAIRFDFFDHEQTEANIPKDSPESRKVALDAAEGSMVLLKNHAGILPLDKSKLKTIAVIGPTADPAVTGGGGSSKVRPFEAGSFLKGIRDYVGNSAKIIYASATETPQFGATPFQTEEKGGEPGLKAEYFNNMTLEGAPVLTRVDKHINFDFGEVGYAEGAPHHNFSARWTGYYVPEESGEYQFQVSGDDGYRLFVNDEKLIEVWHDQGDTLTTKSMNLQAGRPYRIKLEYYQHGGGASIGLGIATGGNRALEEAKEAAAKADVVILCAGFDSRNEGEGSDRTYELPGDQEEMIRQITAANKNTILVLTAGGSVKTEGWIDSVPAMIHTWYPGQEGGTALAKILFGEVDPSGKLPISWERRLEDSATYDSYYAPDLPKGRGGDQRDMTGAIRGHVQYKEGIFLGYRHFDEAGIKPLFPFGYGLSYTTFKYSNLKVAPAMAKADGPVTVSFDITNTGKREGAEVAQVYVSEKHAKVERPVKELKGFRKVSLKPGETKNVRLTLNRRSFAYYDVNGKKWAVDPGEFGIVVGSSSAAPELTGKVTITD